MLMAVVAAAAPRASALKWEPGHLLTNYVDSSGSDFIRVSSTRTSSFAPMVPLSSCMWSRISGAQSCLTQCFSYQLQVLNSAGELLEDVSIAGGSRWTADDHVGWAVASYDGSRVIFVTTDSHSIYSVGIEAPHTVRPPAHQAHGSSGAAWGCTAAHCMPHQKMLHHQIAWRPAYGRLVCQCAHLL